MAAKKKSLQFRVDADEEAHVLAAAKDAGMSKSDFLRRAALARTVVVYGGTDIVLIPATTSSEEHDQAVAAALREALQALNGHAAPADTTSAGAAGSPVVGAPDPAAPAEDQASPPPSADALASSAASSGDKEDHSPGRGDSGASSAPVGVVASSGGADPQSAGSIPEGGEKIAPCPDCGGLDGRHQGFCERVTGEPPVEGTQTPVTPPAPEGSPVETREQFLERRGAELVAEGRTGAVAQLEADAEWRKLIGQSTSTECPNCGTVKLNAAAPCPDCGT